MRSLNHLAMIYLCGTLFRFWFDVFYSRLLDFFQKQRLLVIGLVIDHLYTIGPFISL